MNSDLLHDSGGEIVLWHSYLFHRQLLTLTQGIPHLQHLSQTVNQLINPEKRKQNMGFFCSASYFSGSHFTPPPSCTGVSFTIQYPPSLLPTCLLPPTFRSTYVTNSSCLHILSILPAITTSLSCTLDFFLSTHPSFIFPFHLPSHPPFLAFRLHRPTFIPNISISFVPTPCFPPFPPSPSHLHSEHIDCFPPFPASNFSSFENNRLNLEASPPFRTRRSLSGGPKQSCPSQSAARQRC